MRDLICVFKSASPSPALWTCTQYEPPYIQLCYYAWTTDRWMIVWAEPNNAGGGFWATKNGEKQYASDDKLKQGTLTFYGNEVISSIISNPTSEISEQFKRLSTVERVTVEDSESKLLVKLINFETKNTMYALIRSETCVWNMPVINFGSRIILHDKPLDFDVHKHPQSAYWVVKNFDDFRSDPIPRRTAAEKMKNMKNMLILKKKSGPAETPGATPAATAAPEVVVLKYVIFSAYVTNKENQQQVAPNLLEFYQLRTEFEKVVNDFEVAKFGLKDLVNKHALFFPPLRGEELLHFPQNELHCIYDNYKVKGCFFKYNLE